MLSIMKMAEKYGGEPIHLNPIALSFGHSECNRVKLASSYRK